MWTEILAAIAGAGAGQIISYAFQKRNQRTQTIDEWYKEALSLISHGHGICLSARKRSNLNYGDISEESQEISQRLKEHVSPYPEGVDQAAVEQIQNLSKVFRKMSALTEATEEQSTMESINEIFEMGQMEHSSNNGIDMGEVLNDSTDYSPIMKEIFDETDIDPRLFGSKFGEKFGDAESIDKLIGKMGPALGSNQQSVENIIESQIVSDEWDESLSVGIRIHLQIVSGLCEESINHISEVGDMNSAH